MTELSNERLKALIANTEEQHLFRGHVSASEADTIFALRELLSLRQSHSTGAVGRWFELSGDARLGSCATEGCGGQPTFRLEADGIGSDYCSGCAAKIRGLSPVHKDGDIHGFTEEENRQEYHEYKAISLGVPADHPSVAGAREISTERLGSVVGDGFLDAFKNKGGRSLYTHPKEAEVTVTEEMVELALQVWFDQGIVAERSHHQHPVAMRAALVAALSRKG